MKRKRIDRTARMLEVQSAPVATYGAVSQTRESGLARFTREEKEREAAEQQAKDAEREAPLRQAQAEHSRLLQDAIANDLIAGLDTPSSFLAVTCPSIGDGSRWDGVSPEEIRATMRQALSTAEDQLKGTLTEKGRLRARQLAGFNRGVDWTQSTAWSQLFYLLAASGTMTSEDFIPTPTRQEQPQPESFGDVLERTNGESREGQKTLRAAAMLDYQGEVYNDWYRAWLSAVERDLNWSPTDQDVRHITGYMQSHNLSPLSATSWDKARVALCKAKLLSDNNTLYPDERLAIIIESDDTDTRTYSGKQRLRQMEAQILRA